MSLTVGRALCTRPTCHLLASTRYGTVNLKGVYCMARGATPIDRMLSADFQLSLAVGKLRRLAFPNMREAKSTRVKWGLGAGRRWLEPCSEPGLGVRGFPFV